MLQIADRYCARYSRRIAASLRYFVFELIGELQGGLDVYGRQLRLFAEDFGFCQTTAEPAEDVPDGDSGAADDGLT